MINPYLFEFYSKPKKGFHYNKRIGEIDRGLDFCDWFYFAINKPFGVCYPKAYSLFAKAIS